ncbi:MAG: RDD family protein [Burkholderiaceae bacterium]|nr:RDD family protein [Burkholderiaceae bacterium]
MSEGSGAARHDAAAQRDRCAGGGPAGAEPAAPGILPRLAVMTYEAVLLFGVVFMTGYALLALTGWTHPLQPGQRWLLQAALFVVVGAYFVYCWVRVGQTLPMKSWRLRIVDRDGGLLSLPRAVLRYLLAWTLFAPGLLIVAVAEIRGLASLLVLLASLLVMLAAALLDPRRQLLHDRILGSRVIRD